MPLTDIKQSLQKFSELGVKDMFSELDLSVSPYPWRGDNADVNATAENKNQSMNPYPNGLPDSLQTSLSKAYADLFHFISKIQRQDKPGNLLGCKRWAIGEPHSWLFAIK